MSSWFCLILQTDVSKCVFPLCSLLCSQDHRPLTKNKCGGKGVEQPGWRCIPSLSPCTPGEVWDSCAGEPSTGNAGCSGKREHLPPPNACTSGKISLLWGFFEIHFLPVFVASLDPILSLVQLCEVEVTPSAPMVPSRSHPWPAASASQWLAKLTWKLRGCVSMAQKAWNLQAESSLLQGVLLWQPCSSWLSQQLCEHEAKNITGDSAWHSSAGSVQQGALVAPVWGINTSPTHWERWGSRDPGFHCALVMRGCYICRGT